MSEGASDKSAKKARKTVVRNLRMTPEQAKELDEFLQETDISFSAFVRQAVSLKQPLKNSEPKRKYKLPPPKVDPGLLCELGRIGNNINQLTRSLNFIKADQQLRFSFSFVECLKILQQIQNELHEVIGKLPKINRSDAAVERAKQRAIKRVADKNNAN